MEATLAYILEKYAKKTEKQLQRNLDIRKKSYMAGKADGLRLAKDLLHMIIEYGHNESGDTAEVRTL